LRDEKKRKTYSEKHLPQQKAAGFHGWEHPEEDLK